MIAKDFSLPALRELQVVLQAVQARQSSPQAQAECSRFSTMIDDYIERQQLCHPAVLGQLTTVVSNLKGVEASDAAQITEQVRSHCRECMLHLDDCFMNLLFLAFKSVETGQLMAANRVRPTMRVLAH